MGKVFNAKMLDDNYIEKMNEYKNYVDNHRQNVISSFQELFLKRFNDFEMPDDIGFSTDDFKEAIEEALPDVLQHDLSKYSDEEFYPYLDYYIKGYFKSDIPKDERDQTVQANFDEAWKHHYQHNSHHPKYWYYSNVDANGEMIHHLDNPSTIAAPMRLKDIIHMISDWAGMSKKFGGSTIDWYNNKADDEKHDLNPDTKKIVDELLPIVFSDDNKNK